MRFHLYVFFTVLMFVCCFPTVLGWLDDRHGPSPILYDTVGLPLFVCTDQLLCLRTCISKSWHGSCFMYSDYYRNKL